MVQLKAGYTTGLEAGTWISIPYGSIKRYYDNNGKFLYDLFQFLMVQLKDAKAANVSIEDTYFNSLWFN